MKNRIISAILALCLCASLVAVFTFASSAEGTTGKDVATLRKEVQNFITTATKLKARDDYQNMPEGMQTKAEATVKLEGLVAEATALFKQGSSAAVEDLEAFLFKVFGDWDPEQMDYSDPEKTYREFQNALFLRTQAINEEVAFGEKGYMKISRRDYTIESWRALAAAAAEIAAICYSSTGNPRILTITRSEMWKALQDYYAAYDALVQFEGDKEINNLKGLLYRNLETNETVDIVNLVYIPPFEWKLEELINASQENPNSEATLAYKAWVEGAYAAYNDPDATAEEMRKYVDDNYYLGGEYDKTAYPDKEDLSPYVVESPDEMSDEDFKEKYGEKATRYMKLLNIRDSAIETFRASLFVGETFKKAARLIVFSVSYDKELGYYDQADYTAFENYVNDFFIAANDYRTTDVYLRDACEKIVAARDELMTKKLDINVYEVVYNKVMEYYNSAIKNYRELFESHTVKKLEAAIVKFEEARAEYENYANAGGTDPEKLDTLYQNLISATYYLQQARAEIRVFEPGEDPNQATGSGSTTLTNVTLDGVYNAAKILLNDMTEFNNYMTDAMDEDGAYPYTEDSLSGFFEKLAALQELVDLYEQEEENEQQHTMAKSDFLALMLDAIQIQIELVNVRTSDD